jgi:hypothetical protein
MLEKYDEVMNDLFSKENVQTIDVKKVADKIKTTYGTN